MGFNGLLVGCALATFTSPDWWPFLIPIVAFAAMFSSVRKQHPVPSLTRCLWLTATLPSS
jgi:urea transporter